jgi:hypothetical protein
MSLLEHENFSWMSLAEWNQDIEWWNIYLESFPVNERDSRQQIHFALESNLAYAGRLQCDKQTVAITLIYPLNRIHCTYLHYFAVHNTQRGQNLGSRLLLYLIKQSDLINQQKHGKSLGLIWEIEDLYHSDEKERVLRQKRLKFYEKNGAKLLKTPLIQPPINTIDYLPDAGLAMRLMHSALTPIEDLDQLEHALVKAIYLDKYQKVNQTSNEIIDSFMAQCGIQNKKL